jgi:hypothetical protein
LFHSLFHFITTSLPNNENDPKMKRKMSRKWPKKANRERPYLYNSAI